MSAGTHRRFGLGIRWAGVPIVLAGAVAQLVAGLRDASVVPADTPAWTARVSSGEPLLVRPGSGLVLGPGDELTIRDPDRGTSASEEVTVRVERAGRQSSLICLRLRDSEAGAYRVVVVPQLVPTLTLAAELAREPATLLGSVQTARPRDDPSAPLELRCRLEGPHLALAIDGETVLEVDDARLVEGDCKVRGDGVRVAGFSERRIDVKGGAHELDVDVEAWRAAAAAAKSAGWGPIERTAVASVLLVLAAAALLRVLARGEAGTACTLQSALLALSPTAALAIAAALAGRPVSPLWVCASLAVGVVLGAVTLGRASPTSQESRPASASAWRLALGLAWIAVVAGAAGSWRWQQQRALAEDEHAACERYAAPAAEAAAADGRPATEAWEQSGSMSLDASNALVVPGSFRSFALSAEVELQPQSWLELRCRAEPGGSTPRGVALFLGSDERMRSGFVEEGEVEFTPVGESGGPLPTARPLRLELVADGSRWQARVDGRTIAQADERRHPSGGVIALAADGAVRLSALRIEPVREPAVRAAWTDGLADGARWLGLGLLLALAGAALLRRSSWTRAPALAGWALAAPAFALLVARGEPLSLRDWLLGVAGGVAVLALAALWHGRRWLGVLLPPAGAAALVCGVLSVAGRPATPPGVVGLAADGLDLPRVAAGLVHAQLPGLRRLNGYLVDHTFRGRQFALHKPPGTLRVACLGTSTTWGYGLDESAPTDYPSLLREALNREKGEPAIEVMNAGVRGWTALRMRRFYEEVVAEFDPDVVTVSLYYNDAVHATVGEDSGWLERIAQPDFEYDWIERFRDLFTLQPRSRRLEALLGRLRAGPVDTAKAWTELGFDDGELTPPERFERNLRLLVESVQRTGAKLVLAKEPVSGRGPAPWRREIYAAIDRVGAEVGAPVVDLAQAVAEAGGASLYMDEIHLMPAGNQAVAQKLAPVVEQLLDRSNRTMAALLAQRQAAGNPEHDPQRNDLRVPLLEAQLEQARQRGGPTLGLQLALASERLSAGETTAAINDVRAVLAGLDADADGRAPPDLRPRALELLAAARIRAAGGSWLCPPPPDARPGDPEAARAARAALEELLRLQPGDPNARWMLNVAAMTAGDWPASVPAELLVPRSSFEGGQTVPRFTERGASCGLVGGGLAGGVCLEDFDQDGRLDLVVSDSAPGSSLRCYRNEGEGRFVDRSQEAGLEGLGAALNLLHGDVDNDGDCDLVVLRGAGRASGATLPFSLLANDGAGGFHDVTDSAGLMCSLAARTGGLVDFDGDGRLDLFVAHESCGRDRRPCRLFHNAGDGRFVDVAAEVGLDVRAGVRGCSWGDCDDDGDPDLALALGDERPRLYRNDGRRFVEIGEQAGLSGPLQASATCWLDVDNDGHLDLLVAGWAPEQAAHVCRDLLGLPHSGVTPCLYRNLGGGRFEDVTEAVGLFHALPTLGCNVGDVDNDGWIDLYLGTGESDLAALYPNRLFRNDGGRFVDVTASSGLGDLRPGAGAAFGDVDGDGDQDLVAVLGGFHSGDTGPRALYQNPGSRAHWVTLALTGVKANRSAIGARIRVAVRRTDGSRRDVHQLVGTGGSFGSQSLQAEIGLGDAEAIEAVDVLWPGSGTRQQLRGLAMDRRWRIVEDQPEPEPLDR